MIFSRTLVWVIALLVAAVPLVNASVAPDNLETQFRSMITLAASTHEGKETLWLRDYVDFPVITRNVVMDHKGHVTLQQQARFEEKLRASIAAMLFQINSQAESELRVEVNEVRAPAGGRMIVKTTIGLNKAEYDATFAMQLRDELWRIRNILLAGVNIGRTFKSQFNALMSANGNDVDAVVDQWPTTLEGLQDRRKDRQ